jgi:hypothetical protein
VPHLLDALDEAFAFAGTLLALGERYVVSRYLRGYENPIGNGLYSPAFVRRRQGARREPARPRAVEHAGSLTSRAPARGGPAGRGEGAGSSGFAARGIKEEYPPVGGLALTGTRT